MKKLIVFLAVFVLTFVLVAQADAAELGQVNLKSKSTITAMKNGTMKFKGVKLGNTVGYAKTKWGKGYEGVTSLYKYYDYSMLFESDDDSEDYDTVGAYFTGKRGMKISQYQLESFEYYGSSTTLKFKDMQKYWGKPAFHFVSAGEEHYVYGQTALVYDDLDGQFLGYKYLNKTVMKETKQAFSK